MTLQRNGFDFTWITPDLNVIFIGSSSLKAPSYVFNENSKSNPKGTASHGSYIHTYSAHLPSSVCAESEVL